VGVIADAASWVPDREHDVVLAVELFEHTPVWPQIVRTAYRALRPAGLFVATMAGPGRPPHGALGHPYLLPGEHYANIHPDALLDALKGAGFADITVDQQASPADVRAVARRPA
jgi:SAM-dependent methyltransferase